MVVILVAHPWGSFPYTVLTSYKEIGIEAQLRLGQWAGSRDATGKSTERVDVQRRFQRRKEIGFPGLCNGKASFRFCLAVRDFLCAAQSIMFLSMSGCARVHRYVHGVPLISIYSDNL